MEKINVETDNGIKAEDILEIRNWLQERPYLPQNIPDIQLLRFIHSNYNNLKNTMKTIEIYYQMKTVAPEFFDNRSLNNPTLRCASEITGITVLPKCTNKGYRVLMARLTNVQVSEFVLEDAIKLLFTVVDSLLVDLDSNPPRGLIFLFDQEGVSLKHLTKVSLSTVKKYFIYIQEGMPVRMKSIHIINTNFVIANIMTLIKPFMDKKHANAIVLHTKEKVHDLYDVVQKEILPKDYGGNEPNFNDLYAETLKGIRNKSDWFLEDEKFKVDESKKPQKEDENSGFFQGLKKRLSFNQS